MCLLNLSHPTAEVYRISLNVFVIAIRFALQDVQFSVLHLLHRKSLSDSLYFMTAICSIICWVGGTGVKPGTDNSQKVEKDQLPTVVTTITTELVSVTLTKATIRPTRSMQWFTWSGFRMDEKKSATLVPVVCIHAYPCACMHVQ